MQYYIFTVRFKVLFQRLCESKSNWDEPLAGGLLAEWEALTSDLGQARTLLIPRCCTGVKDDDVRSYSLQGFCNASQKAYAAVVYLQVRTRDSTSTQFLCSKTRVAPVKKVTIPQLELLSALLLARLISTVKQALEPEHRLGDLTCYTDSQVVLCWIKGRDKE